jgi:hypothetical protein
MKTIFKLKTLPKKFKNAPYIDTKDSKIQWIGLSARNVLFSDQTAKKQI